MIRPYQASHLNPLIVDDPERRSHLNSQLPSLERLCLDSSSASSAVMLGAGYFTPLRGFMSKADALAIADEMRTADGLFWPVPILNRTQEASKVKPGEQIALTDSQVDGNPVLAVQRVESVERLSSSEARHLARKVFATDDVQHPGVKTFMEQGEYIVAGPLEVLNYSYFDRQFPDTFRTAPQIRNEISAQGWKKVVAFQTRNPMHRAHEELCKIALDRTDSDGVVIHMLLGKLKAGDIPAQVRDAAIRKMAALYFPPNSVIISGYGFDMLYAGPREAVLHAIFRQNMGASCMIVGRDHAGVGDYYGAFDAQEIFRSQVPADTLDIQIFEADHTAWSKKLGEVVMMRDAPDHQPDDFVLLSGTRVREMLSAGEALPPEFSRPEVAQILMDYYRG